MSGGNSKSGVKAEAVCIIRNEHGIPWDALAREVQAAFNMKDASRIKREECAMVSLPGAESPIAVRNEDGKSWPEHLARVLQVFSVATKSDVAREDVLVVKVGESFAMVVT